jgi:cellulose synthase/poly-beta-1,6-N-acetylglucosamine synthase-like glycosyltransferase
MILDVAMLALCALLVYTWGIYPLVLARVRPAERVLPLPRETCPPAAVLFAACNEERHIAARLRNLVDLDYPAERLHVHVGVDGLGDRTASIAREWAGRHPNIHVHAWDRRRGKTAVLKDLVAACREDVLVLTDANTAFDTDALRILAAALCDPRVGGVCGRLMLEAAAGGRTDEGVYWRWESSLKHRESRLDSCLGANGAIYAVRRHLFWRDIPDNTVIDDFVIGMKIREQGRRMVYEPAAVAHEELPPTVGDEWRRRVRIGAGDYQALSLCRRCLSPVFGRFAWMFWSHKVLRWVTPHLLLLLAAVSACRAAGMAGPVALASWRLVPALLVPALVLLGLAGRAAGSGAAGVLRWLRLCDYFLTMQAALFVGFLRFCRGDLEGRWARSAR